MGREIECELRFAGKVSRGKALLETTELLFRGTPRLRIPFAEITRMVTKRGELAVDWKGGAAVFLLGAEAEKWAAKIKNPPNRLDKLGIKPGLKVAVVGRFEPAFLEEVRTRAEVRLGEPRGGEDLILFAVEAKRDLSRMRAMASRMLPSGALWVVRRKGREASVTENESMAAGKAAGLVDTKVMAFSDTHTAERYVIPVAARKAASPT
jgi:hypothetical protein